MKGRVLLLDDSRAMRMLLGAQVKALGFEFVEAGDGGAGLAQLNSAHDFRLVLVDWNMPVMNGLEFIRAMRACKEFQGIRIIVVTSETEATQVMRALEAGADEYLMKPFTRETLASKLELLGLLQDAV